MLKDESLSEKECETFFELLIFLLHPNGVRSGLKFSFDRFCTLRFEMLNCEQTISVVVSITSRGGELGGPAMLSHKSRGTGSNVANIDSPPKIKNVKL